MLNFSHPLWKVLLPLVTIVLVSFIARRKLHYSWQKDLLLVLPPPKILLFWILVFGTYMLSTDYFWHWRGDWNFQTWQQQSLFTSITRVFAVVIAGPLAEEMLFRGLLLIRLNRTGLNRGISLVLITSVWAGIHMEYSWEIIILIFGNGLLLGLSLYSSRSLLVPMILHMIWNGYAVW
ncbi:CPBP family intramembrane glutamic endopeptidase [Adhaeribacter radiodurans]|uniref:CPBP family intramembrane metalloprotease n=1 Tax=Adhaeribacter radiodurans TaxID=2745197 RepID=A0A7L7L7H9_9BACT|nr:CPBP family intramembrane glutamic endopeptidase [Adhaeribacter radiodurans]QMU28791.1 CPBP family intramembrane metalloprotease [Adhaeribacter radiodurans]